MRRRLLITGASGLLGRCVCRLAAADWEVLGVVHRGAAPVGGLATRSTRADLGAPGEAARLVESTRPDWVLHAAAQADANQVESAPAAARRINVDATRELTEACQSVGARLLFVSTDLVFDGERAPYSESSPPAPLCTYGEQKVEGERWVLERPGMAVCRIPLLVGWGAVGGRRPLVALRDSLTAGRPTPLFVDEYRTPLTVRWAARGLLGLLGREVTGLWHWAGPERISRLELGRRIARALGLDESSLAAARQADVVQAAPRPCDVSLDIARAASSGLIPPPLDEQLRETCADPEERD